MCIHCSGIARKPPAEFLEQLKTLNTQLSLGQLLCRNRKPNFLLDIIKQQVRIVRARRQRYYASTHDLVVACSCNQLLMQTCRRLFQLSVSLQRFIVNYYYMYMEIPSCSGLKGVCK